MMQTYSPELEQVMCKLRTFAFTLGFALAYGSLFSKTWRVYRIFSNKKLAKMSIKDHQLFLSVGALLGVLSFVLILWECIDPQVIRVHYLSNQVFQTGNDVEVHPFIRICESKYSSYFSWTIYGINGILLLFGAFLAFETRTVKIQALNDSHQIGLCLYNVIVLSVLGLTLSFLLGEQQSLIYGITSGFVVLGTTATQAIVFLPKIFSVKHGGNQVDPTGTSVGASLHTRTFHPGPSSNKSTSEQNEKDLLA